MTRSDVADSTCTEGRLDDLARAPVLLVASDYDGTLAPIVGDPCQATPCREAIVALNTLAGLPHTHCAVISGRSLSDLAKLAPFADTVHLIGSHGSEFDVGFADRLGEQQLALLDRISDELANIVDHHSGFLLERKPASIAFHYRNVPDDLAQERIDQVLSGPAALDGTSVKFGKKVVEIGVIETNKGKAFEQIRARVGATSAMFLGDDATDEDVFALLQGPDLAFKVGQGPSITPLRLSGPDDVARLLASLCEKRSAWLEGGLAVGIEHHAMLSDQRAIALVNHFGSINWMCAPRMDAPAIFAGLLGDDADGVFRIRPTSVSTPGRQRYCDDTLTVETRWDTLTITDFLDCSGGRAGHLPGRTDLVRIVQGTGEIAVTFAPRLDFGRTVTSLSPRDGGLVIDDCIDPVILRAPGVVWTIEREGAHHTARARIKLDGRPLVMELRFGTSTLKEGALSPDQRRVMTERFWSTWASRLTLPEIAPDLVRRSALTLRGLFYGPSGAMCAAGTTSLPECVGGVRNWDYRYCWLRDAAIASASLARLGVINEPMRFLEWVCQVVEHSVSPDRIKPLYAVDGTELQAEADLSNLAGYRSSRPVRVGNAAAQQIQLDVFGPVVELVAILAERGAPLSERHWWLVEAMGHAVQRRWREPDHGIWEIRKPRRHHVHSKVMCWVTADRAIQVVDAMQDTPHEEWSTLRDQIRDDVLEHGWKPSRGAFTAAYDGDDLDAAALSVGLSGLVDPDDPRFLSTVRAVEDGLRDGPTVYRYRADDGLPGSEGGFHLCTSWLIRAYALVGRLDDAMELFEQQLALAADIGLFSEEYDPAKGVALGNHPQAYSHAALIDTAIMLSQARQSH